MSTAIVKLVAVLMLVVQGAVALVPGRVLCIPIQHCGTHEHGGSDCGGGWHACVDSHASRHCHGHQHGPLTPVAHPAEDCGCHVHLPAPGEQQMPASPRGDAQDARVAVLPPIIAFALSSDSDALGAVAARLHPPDFSASSQVRALKATRLLI